MKTIEIPPRVAGKWTRLPLVDSPAEPWASINRAVTLYREFMRQRRATPETELVTALVLACVAAAEGGRPFTQTGPNSVHARRGELTAPLSELSRTRLRSLTRRAVTTGLLVRGKYGRCGDLTAP